jgi:hypothetical protein
MLCWYSSGENNEDRNNNNIPDNVAEVQLRHLPGYRSEAILISPFLYMGKNTNPAKLFSNITV